MSDQPQTTPDTPAEVPVEQPAQTEQTDQAEQTATPVLNSLGEDESQMTIPDPQSQGREGDEHLDDIDQTPDDLGHENGGDEQK